MTDPAPEPSAPERRSRWLRGLELDLRSVALFRIALGLCVLADTLLRIPHIREFYTDAGVLPRVAIFGQLEGTWALSLHFISGQWVVQLLLFLATLVFAAGLTLGYRTRVSAVATWFLVMSMQVRSPLVLHGGDDLIRMLLFWSMFVPLNGRFSLDRALNPQAPAPPATLLSPGSLALIFQICAVYWYTAAEKMHPVWLTERSAVYYALSLEQFTTSFGRMLLEYPGLQRFMTTATLVLEMLGPLLVLSPFATAPLRLLAIAAFIAFHAGLGLSLHLGLFPWVCVTAWLVFLPAAFWEFLARRVRMPASTATIFYDGGCGFCRRSVLILRELLLVRGIRLAEAQSDPDVHATMRERNSWIVREPGGSLHSGYDALVVLLRLSPVGRILGWVFASAPARALGERVYRWISSDRDRASRILGGLTPPQPVHRFGMASSVVALLALVLVQAVLSRSPTLGLKALVPIEWRFISLGQLNQSWRMFAPYPTLEDGWYVMEGITADGRRVDAWNGGGSPSYVKPADLWPLYRTSQWQKYLTNIYMRRFREYRVHFGRYLCQSWNARHEGDDRIELVYVNFMLEPTAEPGAPMSAATKESVLKYDCSGRQAET